MLKNVHFPLLFCYWEVQKPFYIEKERAKIDEQAHLVDMYMLCYISV